MPVYQIYFTDVVYYLQYTYIKCESIKLGYFYQWNFSGVNVLYDGYSLFLKIDMDA